MYWTLELASKLEDAPWPATKEELIDYAVRSGLPLEVIENLEEIEDEGDIYETIEDVWPDDLGDTAKVGFICIHKSEFRFAECGKGQKVSDTARRKLQATRADKSDFFHKNSPFWLFLPFLL